MLHGNSIDFHLSQLEDLLVRDAELCAALCQLKPGGSIKNILDRHRLEAAGIIRWDSTAGAYVLRFAIYQRLLERLCR